jgi:hypothetical protein
MRLAQICLAEYSWPASATEGITKDAAQNRSQQSHHLTIAVLEYRSRSTHLPYGHASVCAPEPARDAAGDRAKRARRTQTVFKRTPLARAKALLTPKNLIYRDFTVVSTRQKSLLRLLSEPVLKHLRVNRICLPTLRRGFTAITVTPGLSHVCASVLPR